MKLNLTHSIGSNRFDTSLAKKKGLILLTFAYFSLSKMCNINQIHFQSKSSKVPCELFNLPPKKSAQADNFIDI